MQPTATPLAPTLTTAAAALILIFATACANSGNGGGGGEGECADGATQCLGNTFQTCDGGQWSTTNQCRDVCDNGLGCVACRPGIDYCDGNEVASCDDAGNPTGPQEDCGDLTCSGGVCQDLCKIAEDSQSYIGCEYFALDLDNGVQVNGLADAGGNCPAGSTARDSDVCVYASDGVAGLCDVGASCPNNFTCEQRTACVLDGQSAPFAIVVSNPQGRALEITLEGGGGETQLVTVQPKQVQAIFPQDLGMPEQSINFTSIARLAYRLSANAPFVAYQFNPLDNVNVFSNDGALLIPRHSFDTKYYAATLPSLVRRPGSQDWNGYVSVVAWQDATEVTVTPTAAVRAGESIPAIAAGAPTTFTLNAFEVLNLEAVGGGDLSGTLVESSDEAKTIGVFAGHEGTIITDVPLFACCADHMEEMMFPTSTWGTEYAVARSQTRADGDTDLLRIVAQENGTSVSLSNGSGSCATLGAGEFCDVDIDSDVEVSASAPVLVAHYLKAVGNTFLGGKGDPSYGLAVPTEQHRTTYSILIPENYDENYISIVAGATDIVLVDDNDVSGQLSTFGSGAFRAGRIQVQAGQHDIDCPGKCGVEIHGYSDAVSYMFAGGLDLERIVID